MGRGKGNLYDVYFKDCNNETKIVTYFGYAKEDAERLFKSEQRKGEELIKIVKK